MAPRRKAKQEVTDISGSAHLETRAAGSPSAILLGSFTYNPLAEAMHGFRSWSSLEPDTGAVLMLPIAPSIMPPDPAAPVHRR